MAKTYTLNVAGLTRELTICGKNEHNTNTPSALRQNAQSGRRISV